VVEDVGGNDGVERGGRELQLGEVRVQEGRIRDTPACTVELLGGDVHAGQPSALGKHPRRADAGAHAELQDVGPLRQQAQELLDPFDPRGADDLPLPFGEAVGHRVVAGLDDPPDVVPHD
jgi:hypothetical protein